MPVFGVSSLSIYAFMDHRPLYHYLPCLLLIFSFWTYPSQAQKHDYMWPLGFGSNISEHRFFYNFNNNPPNITLRSDTFSTGLYAASYCDKDGNIQFFSNGQKIFDKNGMVIENGAGLNPTILEWNADHRSSYPGGQSGFFLENPSNQNIVYFISLDFGLHPAQKWPYKYVGQNLLAATIDLLANNGFGKVVEKNKILLSGTLMSPAVCRHANGRDWWIMVSDADENQHYRLLLSPNGFSTPITQYIGTKPNPIPYEGGNKSNQIVGNCFSPSGKYYADINDQLGFSIFKFDRCSGLFSNEQRLNYPPPSNDDPLNYKNTNGTGAVFSQNDSFFYKTTRYIVSGFAPLGSLPFLLQYELRGNGPLSLVDTINVIDSSDYHYPTNITWEGFYGAEMAPDGRIYIANKNLSYSFIQYPDVRGKDCKLVRNMPNFEITIGQAIPYMPNYRLGPLDNSPCDTLGIDNVPVANFRVDDSLGMLSRFFYDLSHHEPATWHWNFGDGIESGEQNPFHTYAAHGIYQVCLTVGNSYGSDSFCRTLYIGVSSSKMPKPKLDISIFPNPFSDQITVTLDSDFLNSIFSLHDQTGRLVLSANLVNETTELNGIKLPDGVCFWELRGESGRVAHGKLIKTEN